MSSVLPTSSLNTLAQDGMKTMVNNIAHLKQLIRYTQASIFDVTIYYIPKIYCGLRNVLSLD